jgi:hypothetical protein
MSRPWPSLLCIWAYRWASLPKREAANLAGSSGADQLAPVKGAAVGQRAEAHLLLRQGRAALPEADFSTATRQPRRSASRQPTGQRANRLAGGRACRPSPRDGTEHLPGRVVRRLPTCPVRRTTAGPGRPVQPPGALGRSVGQHGPGWGRHDGMNKRDWLMELVRSCLALAGSNTARVPASCGHIGTTMIVCSRCCPDFGNFAPPLPLVTSTSFQ